MYPWSSLKHQKDRSNYSSPQHSPNLHPQTRWRDSPACPSCSRRSIWPSFCVWFKFSSINLPSTSCNYFRFPLLSSKTSKDVPCKYYPIWNPLKAMRLALAVLYIESAVTKRPTRKEYSSNFLDNWRILSTTSSSDTCQSVFRVYFAIGAMRISYLYTGKLYGLYLRPALHR